MNFNFKPYAGKNIGVAVSGGKDSMALLHGFIAHAKDYGITFFAINCDHCMRGEESKRDSAFVKKYCEDAGVPLRFFKADGKNFTNEQQARLWRLNCYAEVIEGGADFVATAHHLNDNAETVLFNLARGTYLSGMTGISDSESLKLIRPMIACTREEIDLYIEENGIPFVTDSTNLSEDYTRNKIRRKVLPALEDAVSGAAGAIYRFSRLAAEDEEYFSRLSADYVVKRGEGIYLISDCPEKVIFRRAAHAVVAGAFKRKDYTAEHFERLYLLQSAQNGKKFAFLGLTAIKEAGGVALFESDVKETYFVPFAVGVKGDGFEVVKGRLSGGFGLRVLNFDADKIPEGAQIRCRKNGDYFTKFGGGTKSLSDYLTDKKVPQSLRDRLPVVAIGNEVLVVGGVEISEKVKITPQTQNVASFISTVY